MAQPESTPDPSPKIDLPNMDIIFSGDPRYFVGSLFFLAGWFVLYLSVRKIRVPMLWAGLTLMCTAPIFDYINTKDYWSPGFLVTFAIDLPKDAQMQFGVAGFILGFSVAGMSAGLFDLFVRKHERYHPVIDGINWGRYGRLLLATVLGVAAIFFFFLVAGLDTVPAHCIGLILLTVLFMWRIRSSWILPSLKTAGVMVVFMMLFYYAFYLQLYPDLIKEWWYPKVWKPALFGVPLWEYLWGAANALYIGPAVRFCLDKDFDKHES